MRTLFSVIAAGVVALGLAAVAAYGVVSSNTSAPSKNPAATNNSAQYGN
jgi:hypothetical protein